MLRNYIAAAFRSFKKQKGFTALNILGLSLAMASSIALFQYVDYEKSFDAYHERAEDIYRLQYNAWQDGKLNFESAMAVPAAAPALKNNFPEVEAFARLFPIGGVMSYKSPTRGYLSFHEERMPYADQAILKIFDIQVTRGNKEKALTGPDKVMLSGRAAHKYFGDEDPLGKTLDLAGVQSFEVTGVFKDIPENSHIRFDFLLSYETLKKYYDSYDVSWWWYDFYSYMLLKPGTDAAALQNKWNEYLYKLKKNDWKDNKQEFILRPLLDIHLHSNLQYEAIPNEQRDGDSIDALGILAIFIIVIAWINYINLATARSFKRAKEVGIKKVIGAARRQLITQFFIESVLINLLALIIGVVLLAITWPYFSILSGWYIPLSMLYDVRFLGWVLSIFICGTFLSGFYPAIVLSSFKPLSVLKGKISGAVSGEWTRRSLVVVQFTASIFLICGSFIVYQQLQFMKYKDLGVNIDKTLVLKGAGSIDSLYAGHLESFTNDVLALHGVENMTSSTSIPGEEIYWTGGIKRISGGPDYIMVSHMGIDPEFIPAYGLKVISGRNVNKEHDETRVIVNRKLVETLGFESPEAAIGQFLSQQGDTIEIIGVVENFHQLSLKKPVEPLVFMRRQSAIFYSLKMGPSDPRKTLVSLERVWKKSFPDAPFDYFYLDRFFNKQYELDNRFGKVFTLFTTLSIMISILGLLGLASFIASMRIKEIGIRKVLGSTVWQLVLLLSKGFLVPVIIANLLAWPFVWFMMERWLQSFPYHISISVMLFPLVGLIVLLIAFLSVSSQTLGAALSSPSQTLKHE
ncbi:MAG TPA: ABC transporter permease [Chryseolinea sp.]|nr:ABC transporter permease [Chryseolinea sp.]